MTESGGEAVTYGRWSVIGDAGKDKNGNLLWHCQCECGTKKTVHKASLIHGRSQSCGCRIVEYNFRHGLSRTRIYESWVQMHRRCDNQEDPNYGARGISVCDRWRDFAMFHLDMGDPPDGQTLDRIDNDGNYEPSNCRWATPKQQGRNTRFNRIVEFEGKKQCVAAWAEEVGLEDATLRTRLRKGWSVERALTTPTIMCKDTAP